MMDISRIIKQMSNTSRDIEFVIRDGRLLCLPMHYASGIYINMGNAINDDVLVKMRLSPILSYLSQRLKEDTGDIMPIKIADIQYFDIIKITDDILSLKFSSKQVESMKIDIPLSDIQDKSNDDYYIRFPRFKLNRKSDYGEIYISDLKHFRQIINTMKRYSDIVILNYNKEVKGFNILFPLDNRKTKFLNLLIKNVRIGNPDVETSLSENNILINIYYLADILNIIKKKSTVIKVVKPLQSFIVSIPIEYNADSLLACMDDSSMSLKNAKIYTLSYSRLNSFKYIIPRLKETLYDYVSDDNGNRDINKFVDMGLLKFTELILKSIWRRWNKYTYLVNGDYIDLMKIYIEEKIKHEGGNIGSNSIFYNGHTIRLTTDMTNIPDDIIDKEGMMTHIVKKGINDEIDVSINRIIPVNRTYKIDNSKGEKIFIYQTYGMYLIME